MSLDDELHDAERPPAPDAPGDPLAAFPAFAERVRLRLEAGRAYEATKPAVGRPTLDLVREIQEELEDLCGWSCALWTRLEGLRAGAAKVDEDTKNQARPARGDW